MRYMLCALGPLPTDRREPTASIYRQLSHYASITLRGARINSPTAILCSPFSLSHLAIITQFGYHSFPYFYTLNPICISEQTVSRTIEESKERSEG